MVCKTFEVRDRMTFMPVLAIKLESENPKDVYLLRAAGYENPGSYVILVKLDGVEAQYDPFKWPDAARTKRAAHDYILENFDHLESGDVIDLEFILGEKPAAKMSQRLTSAVHYEDE